MLFKKFLLSFLFATSVASAEISLQPIAGTDAYTLKISKTVLSGDVEKFKAALDEVENRKLKLHMNAVQLDVAGGDPVVAKNIGRMIRGKGLNTFLAPHTDCVSACIYLAISGLHRMIYGNVLLHRLTLFKEDLTENEVKEMIDAHTQDSDQYVADMGVSRLLNEAINFTPNWALRRLDPKEIKHWGIFGSDHVHDELMFRRAAKQAGVSMDKLKSAYVKHFDICRKDEYSFKSFVVDCTVAQLKQSKK
jgi:hypothetical protein